MEREVACQLLAASSSSPLVGCRIWTMWTQTTSTGGANDVPATQLGSSRSAGAWRNPRPVLTARFPVQCFVIPEGCKALETTNSWWPCWDLWEQCDVRVGEFQRKRAEAKHMVCLPKQTCGSRKGRELPLEAEEPTSLDLARAAGTCAYLKLLLQCHSLLQASQVYLELSLKACWCVLSMLFSNVLDAFMQRLTQFQEWGFELSIWAINMMFLQTDSYFLQGFTHSSTSIAHHPHLKLKASFVSD